MFDLLLNDNYFFSVGRSRGTGYHVRFVGHGIAERSRERFYGDRTGNDRRRTRQSVY